MNFVGQYLKYDEYRLMGGTKEIMPFNLLEYEARKIIDVRTQRRLVGLEIIPQDVKMCVNAIINVIESYESTTNKNISSESVGDYSVSYVSSSQINEVIKSKESEIEDIMFNYLSTTIVDGTPILYLGVC